MIAPANMKNRQAPSYCPKHCIHYRGDLCRLCETEGENQLPPRAKTNEELEKERQLELEKAERNLQRRLRRK